MCLNKLEIKNLHRNLEIGKERIKLNFELSDNLIYLNIYPLTISIQKSVRDRIYAENDCGTASD
jgi:hypothetical protein